MTKKIISAFIALAIFIPIFIIGGALCNIIVYLWVWLGLKEFLDIRETKKKFPDFIKFVSYVIVSLIYFGNSSNIHMMTIDIRVIAGLFLVFLIPTVLYHDKEKYSITDAFYLIGGIFFIGVSFSLITALRNVSLAVIIYLFLITIMTDSFAYFTGKLIGKTKLLEVISPNKTWEGMIGGTVFGVFIATMFYHVVINPELSILTIVFMTLFLSILAQLGDLVFSAIKRYYGKKDFSNLMPEHGGVLDRFDSILFVVLGFLFFISIL